LTRRGRRHVEQVRYSSIELGERRPFDVDHLAHSAKRIEVAVVATWHRHDGLGSLRDSEYRRQGRWHHVDFVEA
jgi:hypothetical protein